MTDEQTAEWDDGYIVAKVFAHKEQYKAEDGIAVTHGINNQYSRNGNFLLHVRHEGMVYTVRLTPADVGRLHEQARGGNPVYSPLPEDQNDDPSRDAYREFLRGSEPA